MDPKEINLYMVMKTLDGTTSPLDCLIHPNDCVFSDTCAQQEVWKSVEDAVQEVLRNITVFELAERHRRLESQVAVPANHGTSAAPAGI